MRAGEASEADTCPVRGSAPCRFLWEGTTVFSPSWRCFQPAPEAPPECVLITSNNQLPPGPQEESLIRSVCRLLWCKRSHQGQLPSTSLWLSQEELCIAGL